MSKRLFARNMLIAQQYSRDKRNGPEIAARFNLSLGRVHQIVEEYGGKENMKKYTERIQCMVEVQVKQDVETIAENLSVSPSVIIRWALDDVIVKYREEYIEGKEPEAEQV